ncbi:MAG: helix-turn-helix domain-containing protein [Actinomycetota bacterium]|nr:helix-turn-helix domain-containing protein [Actinomycetota bacterium]
MKPPIIPTVDPHQLGDYVKRMRERRGFSVRGLAAAARVDATWLSRLEHGEYTSPDPRHLRLLAQVLEIETADLYVMAGYRGGEGLPGFVPYLRAKYDLPAEAIEQLQSHFELINEKYKDEEGSSDARRGR